MIRLRDVLAWVPDAVGEDRVSGVLFRALPSDRWGLVYYNPPSGSWKGVSLYRGGYEYRQVGPKRGVRRMKRPDVALQDLSASGESPRLLLFEVKREAREWDKGLPALLEAYFEEPKEGVRRLGFDHRRRVGQLGEWERLEQGEPERNWFASASPEYLFGFAYGPVREDQIEEQRGWMCQALVALGKNRRVTPALVMVAVGFDLASMRPIFAKEYSETFPKDVRESLNVLFDMAASSQ